MLDTEFWSLCALTVCGPTPRSCRACGYYARYYSSLIVHARTHTQEKPYKCRECDYGSTQHSNLKKHEAIHRRSQLLANHVAQVSVSGTNTEDTSYSAKVRVMSDPSKASGESRLSDAAVAVVSAQHLSDLTSSSLPTRTGEQHDRNPTHTLQSKVFYSIVFFCLTYCRYFDASSVGGCRRLRVLPFSCSVASAPVR